MSAKDLKKRIEKGEVTTADLLEVIGRLEKRLAGLEAENRRLRKRLEQYEPAAEPTEEDNADSTDYSLASEEKRRTRRRAKPKRWGRRGTEVKLEAAQHWEDVYPPGAAPKDCVLVRRRVAWRIREGRAVLVGYRVYRRCGSLKTPQVPGLLPRSEYGIEVMVVLAFLTCTMRVSLDQACALLKFFCDLPMAKAQANALLNQLAKHWQPEFETLCELIALALVVYMDETSWPVGKDKSSLWVFLTGLHSLYTFGCAKDDATLNRILPPEVFGGIGVSDDAAVYHERFGRGQKCWAHLLRKLIALTLLYPEKTLYRTFLDEVYALFLRAKRCQGDSRLSPAGRERKAAELSAALLKLCQRFEDQWRQPRTPDQHKFTNLVLELLKIDGHEELFTFVRFPEVEATNNAAERALRGATADRKLGRTSKSAAGAHRRSVLVSVLESLRKNLECFTLAGVVAEVRRWLQTGVSLFRRQLDELKAKLAAESEPAPCAAGPSVTRRE